MDARRIKEEMQFITNVVTNDIDYLMYLLLKDSKKDQDVEEEPDTMDEGYFNDSGLDEWFNSL